MNLLIILYILKNNENLIYYSGFGNYRMKVVYSFI